MIEKKKAILDMANAVTVGTMVVQNICGATDEMSAKSTLAEVIANRLAARLQEKGANHATK